MVPSTADRVWAGLGLSQLCEMFRAELAGLKVGALRKRARAAGADMVRVEEAIDEEDKAAIIELVMQAETRHLRAELAGMKVGALRKRAKAAGADMARVEDAIDEEDKAAIVELIVEAGASAGRTDIPEGVAEKPTSTSEPEPEPATREMHSAAGEPAFVDVAGAANWTVTPIEPSNISDFLPALCIFGSMRFPVPLEARLLFAALQAAGVHLKVVDMKAGQDIDKEVYEWIEHCHAFLAFGTKNYGEDTGNSACTYNEVKFAQAKKKNIILLRMIPWEEEFEELQARVLFNRNMLTLEWQQGQAMPPNLVGEILKAMDLPPTGVSGSPAALAHQTTVAEATKAQAQAQIAQAHASSAAAKAQAEAMQAQAEAEQAMAIAAAEEEAARRMQEEARAVQIAERERQAEAAQRELRARTMSELETAEPRRVLEILELPLADAEVHKTGWSAIGRQSDAGPGKQTDYGRAFASAGGLEAMVVALRQYQASVHVVENVLRTAFALARDDSNCAAIGSGGGIEAVVAAMRSHGGSAAVQEMGCNALSNLSFNDSNRAAIGSGGGIEAVVAAMRSHGGSAAVQEEGCRALSNLSLNHANVVAIRKSGGTKVLQEARARLSDKSDIVELAEGTLQRL
eukprot:COSAG02_NODE_1235_length_13736_cov_12.313265_10_plen_630_part_00